MLLFCSSFRRKPESSAFAFDLLTTVRKRDEVRHFKETRKCKELDSGFRRNDDQENKATSKECVRASRPN